jgi:two-component system response regulator DesR
MIRVVLVDDMDLLRNPLTASLQRAPGIEVVTTTEAGWDARAIEVPDADVAIVNADSWAMRAAFQVAQTLVPQTLAAGWTCAVLILADPRRPITWRPWLGVPAMSLMAKDVSPAVLVEGVRRLAAGERMIDQRIAIAALTGGATELTTRDLEVLRLAADGASVAEIADRLYLSIGTVRNYLSRIIGKAGARNLIDAVRIAREAGWLTSGAARQPDLEAADAVHG